MPVFDLFFYGTLQYPDLLACILGHMPQTLPAHLPGYAVRQVEGHAFPMILPEPGAQAQGILAQGLSEEDLAALDFYEGGFGYVTRELDVQIHSGAHSALIFFPEEQNFEPGAPWEFGDWRREWGDITLRSAHEVMARRGVMGPEAIHQMMPFLQARSWARELASDPAPQRLRSSMGRDQIEIPAQRPGWNGFFTLTAFDLRYQRFDGKWSNLLSRECFVSFDVALVLPYDPATDRLLLVEQLRFGPIMRGDPAPWILEPVAGLVDARECPQATAHRETREEANLQISEMIPMVKGYGSPGYSTEFYHCFLGIADLTGRGQSHGGLAQEDEDIRNHVISFDHAMALLDSGEINAAPLAMMLLWLARWRERQDFRAGHGQSDASDTP